MKKISIFVLAILVFTACKKDKKNSLPIAINFTSSVNLSSPTLTCTLPGTPFAIANSGYFLDGTATHLGRIDASKSMGQDGFCNLNAAFLLTTKTAGQVVAANGDKITYTGDDLIDLSGVIAAGSSTAPITGLWTITGGTGKFAGASGSVTVKGTVDVAAKAGPVFSITGEGTIVY